MSANRCRRSFSKHRRGSCTDVRRQIGSQRAPIRLAADDGGNRVGHILALERAPPCQQFVRDTTERPDVRAFVGRCLRACSGLMHATVPRMTPAYVACALSVGDIVIDEAVDSCSSIFARPKSSTFTGRRP